MKRWLRICFKTVLFVCCGPFLLSSCHAQQNGLRETLETAADVIEHHTYAESAILKVVSVEESRQYALKTDDRIAGYPVTGTLISLDKEKSQQLANLLLDKNSYANIRQRCKNQYFHGIRFSKEHKKIEVAIGIPCNQVLVFFHDGEETKWWGGTFGNTSAKQALLLLPQEGP